MFTLHVLRRLISELCQYRCAVWCCLLRDALMFIFVLYLVFFFKQKTAYEVSSLLVGSEMFIRGRYEDGKFTFIELIKHDFTKEI